MKNSPKKGKDVLIDFTTFFFLLHYILPSHFMDNTTHLLLHYILIYVSQYLVRRMCVHKQPDTTCPHTWLVLTFFSSRDIKSIIGFKPMCSSSPTWCSISVDISISCQIKLDALYIMAIHMQSNELDALYIMAIYIYIYICSQTSLMLSILWLYICSQTSLMLSILWLYICSQTSLMLSILCLYGYGLLLLLLLLYIYAVKRFSSATPSFISSISGYLY